MSLVNGNLINHKIEQKSIWGPYGFLDAVIHNPLVQKTGYMLILCHGFRGSKDGGGRAVALAEKAAALGFAVVRFDFTPLSILSRQVEELAAVADYCRNGYGRQIIILGRSMGGSATLSYAAKDQDVAGVCLWSTPHDLHSTFKFALGDGYDKLKGGKSLTARDDFGSLKLEPDFVADFDNFDLLDSVKSLAGVPLLVVHGSEDELVPLAQAREVFAAAGQPKDIVIIPGGDHRFLVTHQIASGAVLNWLGRMFADNGGI